MKSYFGPDADAVMKQSPAKSSPLPAAALGDAITDRRFASQRKFSRNAPSSMLGSVLD
jgi:hypothetical protein